MKRPARLSAAFVKTVKDPGRYGDGRGGFGLSLLVQRRAAGGLARSWSQRLWIDGGPVNVGLGAYPIVTLAEARAKALENRRMVERGEDPRKPRRTVPTFADACERVIELHRPTWKNSRTAGQWRGSLAAHALPVLGGMTVDTIGTGDVLRVLRPLWTDRPAIAGQLRTRISAVMRWCIGEGHRTDNPAGDAVTAALPRQNGTRQHHRAADHADVAGVLATVRDSGAWEGAKLALAFTALTATRGAEARGATWVEIDGDTWNIPGERMKTGRPHRIPLSRQALDVLREARALSRGGVEPEGVVFPAVRGGELSGTVLLRALAGTDSTVHGFRSSFRSWCADTGVDRELAEAALAHVAGTVERAYQRSDMHERRRDLMQSWADYIMPK